MSYTPHTWAVGDVITAERLNALEQAVANSSIFDAEIKIYHDNNSSSSFEITRVSGTFASLYQKLSNGIAPSILIRYFNELTGARTATTAVPVYAFDSTSIILFVKNPVAKNDDSYTNEWDRLAYLIWNSGDSLYFD